MHAPTDQQSKIIQAADSPGTIVVQALAGCGKTTTFEMIADHLAEQGRGGIYIAFNKAIAQEVEERFAHGNIDAGTIHSLAWQVAKRHPFTRPLMEKMNSDSTIPRAQEARHLGIEAFVDVRSRHNSMQKNRVMATARKVLNAWCLSDKEDVDHELVRKIEPSASDQLCEHIVEAVRKMWDDLLDPDGKVKFNHAHYLKLVSLMQPDLVDTFSIPENSVLMFDEAQDSAPVVTHLLSAQKRMQLIVVGDSNQSINRFAGGIDQLPIYEALPGARTFPLSRTFRFGTELTALANCALSALGSPVSLESMPEASTKVRFGAPRATDSLDAVLVRSNAALIDELVSQQNAGRKVAVEADLFEIVQILDDVDEILSGNSAPHRIRTPELKEYPSIGAFEDWINTNEEPSPAKTMAALGHRIGTQTIRAAIEHVVDKDKADVVVSTIHKAKGKEWGMVYLAVRPEEIVPTVSPQSPELFYQDADGKNVLTPEARDDFMLWYVAVTRAKKTLIVPKETAAKMNQIMAHASELECVPG